MQDIIIKNGLIADGSGNEPYAGAVAVKDGVITAVGDVSGMEAALVIDAEGMVIAPGFIDAHCHSDVGFIKDERCESRIYQGVTTEVCGMCGDSYFPCRPENKKNISSKNELPNEPEWASETFGAFLARVEAEGRRMAVNLRQMTGHGALRAGVMGYADRRPTEDELREMCEKLEKSLQEGSLGLSLGLEYTPGCFADTEELTALAAVVKKYDGLVTAHMRDEGKAIFAAVEEIIEVGRRSGARVHISHLKIDRPVNWGRAPEVWQLIENARNEGIRISADCYPYVASCTGITNRCPKWAIEGGVEAAAAFLQGPRREEVLEHMRGRFPDAEWAERCLVSCTHGVFPRYEGKTLREIAEDMALPYAEAAAELIVKTNGHTDCIFFTMSEDDLNYFLSREVCICSDGKSYPLDPAMVGTEKPHPRYYGAIVRFLRLARENRICSLGKAVQRVTAKAADMAQLSDRGRLQPGLAADITVFNPDTIADRATFLNLFQKPEGICHVIVNGRPALLNGVQTEERAGKYLLK